MTRVIASRRIEAPIDAVFSTFADIENLPAVNPDVLAIEFVTEQKRGVGTQFKETRRMGDRQMVTELEVTEHVENERCRIVTDSHGTIWDTTFTVTHDDGATRFELVMDARPHALVQRLLVPLMKGMFRKGIEKYADDVKAHCEGSARPPPEARGA